MAEETAPSETAAVPARLVPRPAAGCFAVRVESPNLCAIWGLIAGDVLVAVEVEAEPEKSSVLLVGDEDHWGLAIWDPLSIDHQRLRAQGWVRGVVVGMVRSFSAAGLGAALHQVELPIRGVVR